MSTISYGPYIGFDEHNSNGNFRCANERIDTAINSFVSEDGKEVIEKNKDKARVYVESLADVRRAAELTQNEVASILDVDQPTVSKIERRKDLLLSTLRKYLTGVGVENPRIVVEKNGIEVSLDLEAFSSEAA